MGSPGKDLSVCLKCLVIMGTHRLMHAHTHAHTTTQCAYTSVGVGVVLGLGPGVGVLRTLGASCKLDKPMVASAVNLAQ